MSTKIDTIDNNSDYNDTFRGLHLVHMYQCLVLEYCLVPRPTMQCCMDLLVLIHIIE